MWLVRAGPVAAALLLAGCGGDPGRKLVPVSGTVTLDGKPLPDGVVVFAFDGEIPREIKITDGRYDGQAFAGRNHVQFASYRPVGKPKANAGPGANDGVPMENVLPGKYNQQSKEFRELADGANTFDFDLWSK